jgi:hypothetical protein
MAVINGYNTFGSGTRQDLRSVKYPWRAQKKLPVRMIFSKNPVSTFPDHALEQRAAASALMFREAAWFQ